jgi:hypothetical protein
MFIFGLTNVSIIVVILLTYRRIISFFTSRSILLWKKRISSKYFFKSLNFNLNNSLELYVSFKESLTPNLLLHPGVEEDVSLSLTCALKY